MTTRTKQPLTQVNAAQPYLTESSEFRAWLSDQRQNAVRMIEDLDNEITELEAQIQARMTRRRDIAEIVFRADAALGLDVPVTGALNSPTVTEPTED